jgi:hypothetical protein
VLGVCDDVRVGLGPHRDRPAGRQCAGSECGVLEALYEMRPGIGPVAVTAISIGAGRHDRSGRGHGREPLGDRGQQGADSGPGGGQGRRNGIAHRCRGDSCSTSGGGGAGRRHRGATADGGRRGRVPGLRSARRDWCRSRRPVQSPTATCSAPPRIARDPYATGVPGVFLSSSATPPGPGVHGMCGYGAAGSALKYLHGGALSQRVA